MMLASEATPDRSGEPMGARGAASQRRIENRDLLASTWTWSAAAPGSAWSSPHDIRTRVEAVAAAGWRGVGFIIDDLIDSTEKLGIRGLKSLLDDNGIDIVELEGLHDWWAEGAARQESDRVRRQLFDFAAELGATTFKAWSIRPDSAASVANDRDLFVKGLNALATDAASHGLRVAIEPTPMSPIMPTIADGAAIVREADHPAAGLAVDFLHVVRSGVAIEDLATLLPMDKVFVVELDDGDKKLVGSLWEDNLNRRRIPGEGEFHPERFVAVMHDLGWQGHWGVEILSADLRAMPIDAGVTRVHKATSAVIAAAELL